MDNAEHQINDAVVVTFVDAVVVTFVDDVVYSSFSTTAPHT